MVITVACRETVEYYNLQYDKLFLSNNALKCLPNCHTRMYTAKWAVVLTSACGFSVALHDYNLSWYSKDVNPITCNDLLLHYLVEM